MPRKLNPFHVETRNDPGTDAEHVERHLILPAPEKKDAHWKYPYRHGGWLYFPTKEDARNYFLKHWDEAEIDE